MENGYSFVWKAWSQHPYLVRPDGAILALDVHHFVPFLSEATAPLHGEDARAYKAAPAPPAFRGSGDAKEEPRYDFDVDLTSFVATVSCSSAGHPRAPGAPADHADDESERAEPGANEARLRREAKSYRHLLTHQPYNPFCEGCKLCKLQKKHARRRDASKAEPRPDRFGLMTTGDTFI